MMQSGVKIYLLSVGVSARTGVIGDDNYRLGLMSRWMGIYVIIINIITIPIF